MTRTLLIDADIIAYKSTAANERKYDWGDGVVSRSADFEAAKSAARDEIEYLMEHLEADDCIVCLSDDVQNFRTSIYPVYKTNRASTERPEHLYDLKEWFASEYTVAMRPRLEADDVMGILSTEPHEGERIIVSADKDMQTVPGLLFNPNKDTKVRRITPEFAERFMLWQALTGDQTDGYPGCPGVGPKTADAILDDFTVKETVMVELKSGPRKGQLVPRKHVSVYEDRWTAIVAAYREAGLTEKDAVTQVNLARILKHGEIDGNRVIPWVP